MGGLLFTAFSLRSETKSRRIANLLTITSHHREIWSELYHRPELARVLDAGVDLSANPVRQEEELLVRLLILRLSSTYHAMQSGVFVWPEGVRQDIRLFLALPIPLKVWNQLKVFQDKDFVRFIELCRRNALAPSPGATSV